MAKVDGYRCPTCKRAVVDAGDGMVSCIDHMHWSGPLEWAERAEPLTVKELIALANKQPAPKPGTVKIHDLVIADLEKRVEEGREKYGTYLQAFNGRDALRDAYEEQIDQLYYLRQEMAERDHLRALVDELNETVVDQSEKLAALELLMDEQYNTIQKLAAKLK